MEKHILNSTGMKFHPWWEGGVRTSYGSENKLSLTISHGQEVTFSLVAEFPNKDDYLGGVNIVPGTKCFIYIITISPAATKSREDFLYPFYRWTN